jgi:lipopolysaccharide export system protein LptA
MTIANIVQELDAEIVRLQQAGKLLSNGSRLDTTKLTGVVGKGRAKARRSKKRVLSPETRQRIAEAQRKRWASQKRASK